MDGGSADIKGSSFGGPPLQLQPPAQLLRRPLPSESSAARPALQVRASIKEADGSSGAVSSKDPLVGGNKSDSLRGMCVLMF